MTAAGPGDLGPVPDVPDVMVGWRAWKVEDTPATGVRLVSPLQNTPWPARRPLDAACSSVRRHRPPEPGCRCGLYGVTAPSRMMGVHAEGVLGCVALWGEVVEGTDGWRASRGYPRLLVTGTGSSARTRKKLARRYGVPVHRSKLPLDDLVPALDAVRGEADGLRAGTRTWGQVQAAIDALPSPLPASSTRPTAPARPAPSGPAASYRPSSVPGRTSDEVAVRAGGVAVLLIALGAVAAVLLGAPSAAPGPAPVPAVAAGPVAPPAPVPVSVPLQSPSGVAVTPDGRSVYVADSAGGGLLTVVDTATASTTATTPLPTPADHVAISPDGRRAYVADDGTSAAPGSTLTVVDTATHAVTARIPVGLEPWDVLVSPDGRTAYVGAIGVVGTPGGPGSTVSVVDTATDTVTATIPVGAGPARLGISRDGSRLYVPSWGTAALAGSTVTVVDTATRTPRTVLAGDWSPRSALPSPDGRRVYLVCGGTARDPGSVQVLDTATGIVTRLGDASVDHPREAALSPDGRTLVVPEAGLDTRPGTTVSLVDTTSGAHRTVALSERPTSVAVTPDGRDAWVTTASAGLWRIPLTP